MAEQQFDVAVVGYGPVGASLANLLALRGLSVVVVERESGVFSLPRAIQFDGEVMRTFQTIGIADELLPDLVVAARMAFTDDEGRVLIDWKRPTDITPQGWNTSYRFHQPTLERLLRSKLDTYPQASVFLDTEVTQIDDSGDQVTLTVTDRIGGGDRQISAKLVVGCDGARSTTREHLDIALDDLRSHERWLVVDCLLHEDKPELGDDSIQYCDPKRPATYVRGPHNRRRWEFMLLEHEDADTMKSEEMVWKLLEPWISREEATIERPAVYTFHSVVANNWGKGNVFLAGDSCHQTPPFMGQGMCAGIRDASNLAWKIADVVQGRAPQELLHTYEAERPPHVRTFIETAVRLGSVISTTDPEVARERNMRMCSQPEGFSTPQPRLGPGLWDATNPAAGYIGEQPFMADGSRLDDLVGYHWTIFATPDAAAKIRASDLDLSTAPVVVESDSESGDAWLGELDAVAVLVRPDRYIAASARTLNELTTFVPAVQDFNDEIDAANDLMAWGASGVNSWYKNASGRVSQNWPHSLLDYFMRTRAMNPSEYDVTTIGKDN